MNNQVRPHQLLPLPEPSKFDPSTEDTQYFYKNFASQFIEDMIMMTNAGIHIDSGAVESLRVQVTSVLKDVEKRLGRSPVIRKFQEIRAKKLQEQHAEKATQAIRVLGDFLRPYNEKDITHRTWVINTYVINSGFPKDTKDKWTLKCVKDYCVWNNLPFLEAIKARKDISNFPITKDGMVALAEHKLDLWNKPRYESAANPVKVPPFNAGSSKQKQELFSSLNIGPLEFSKTTGDGSWGREQLEILLKTTVNEELKEILEAFIDHSFSGIIRNTFLKAFDSYTIDGTLYGNIKLFGAKSFRPTCLVGDTLVQSVSGLVPIKELKPNMLVPTTDGTLQKVVNTFDNGLAPVFQITLEDGQSVTGTSNHKFLTEDGYLSIEDICNVETSQRSTEIKRANPAVMEGKPFVVSSRHGSSFNSEERTYTQDSCVTCRTGSDYQKETAKSCFKNRKATQKIRTFNCNRFSIFRTFKHRGNCVKAQNQLKTSESGIKQKIHQKRNFKEKQTLPQQRKQNFKQAYCSTSQRDGKVSYIHYGQERLFTDGNSCMDGEKRKYSFCTSSSNTRSVKPSKITQQLRCSSRQRRQNRQSNRESVVVNKRSTFKTASGSSPIKSIKYVGTARVYDVEIETNHCYLANGIWSHNSNNPNLLNMPSTGSVYAKPLKQCFNAPEGYLVWSIDYAALEERVLASLSKDENKCEIFQQGLDSHCFNAMGYFMEEIGTHIKLTGDLVEDTKTFKAAIDNGNKDLKAIRQKSKPINFKLNYQGMADADKGGVITQEIYDAYHEKLYKQVGEFRDDMISTAKEKGYVHLGLGCRIYTEDPVKEYRTLFNAYGGQFWSILSLIAINELNYQKKEAGLDNDIIVNATIYDSIYGYIKKDAKTIKWLNETIVPIMEKDFVEDQIIKNSADLCIGTTWANVEDIKLPKEISLIEIEELIKEF